VAYCETVPQPICVHDEICLSGDPSLRPGVRIASDVGLARIGVASCDPAGLLASPLATVARGRGDMAELARLTDERAAIEIVAGLPRSLSGREGASAADARGFAVALAGRVAPVPVRLVDERFTTVLAHDALRQGGRNSKARRPVVDQAAAALILQGALDTERSTGRAPGELVAAKPDDAEAAGGARAARGGDGAGEGTVGGAGTPGASSAAGGSR
jgi:putative holliday junction resolvase